MQARLRRAAMSEGVTLVAPETVFFSHDTRIGRDVVVEPYVYFGPGVVVEEGAVVHAFSHLEGARVAAKREPRALCPAAAGRFAREKRPGSAISSRSRTPRSAPAPRSTTSPMWATPPSGRDANIGAGTITCNYDGFSKHRTAIGEGAFVGTNSSLVAPVTIGDGAYIGSGSVITDDVPADALALGRGRQAVKEGWAAAFRQKAGPKKGGLRDHSPFGHGVR
jgi:bifunctional UDP-N-acetylglucosamine pyrophosphorylase/glucosamine-1-phosphate N-acetyltransferase